MRHERDMAGAFPVAVLERLSGAEALTVRCLRGWSDGNDAVLALLAPAIGPAKARACLASLTEVMRIVTRHGRRPIVCHGAGCACVGSDEAVFARFVSTAATGEREDAMLIASLLVDGPLLLPMTEAARQAGLYLYQAGLRQGRGFPEPASVTRH